MRIALFLFALSALFAGSTARAQVVEDRPIVVSGQKGSPKAQAQRQIRQIVTAVDGQLARFADPVCPIVIGLSPESNVAVVQRVRLIATEIGAKVGDDKCEPNIVVIIAADADVFTAALRKRFPKMFAYLRPGELRRAKKEGPVHAWNTVEVRNEDGIRADGGEDGDPPSLEVRTASNIVRATQQVTTSSIVVIDDQAALGKSLTQIADYVAMRTLAGARPPRQAGMADTILSLFDKDGAPPPPMLSALDESFIRELYTGDNNVTARQKTREAARRAVKQP